jgi:hypothetical protein
MTHQEGPLAEQGIAPDVAEVLQQDPADEAQVQTGEQQQVIGAHEVAGREDSDQERDAHIAGGQHHRGHRAAVGQPDRPERVARADRKPGRGDDDRLPAQRGAGSERYDPGHDADHRELGAAQGADRERSLAREVDPVDGLVRDVIAGHGEQQESEDHDQGPGQQCLAASLARLRQAGRREHREQHENCRAAQQHDEAQAGHLLLP